MSISSAEIDVGRVLDRWNGAGSGDSSFIAKPMCLGDDVQLGQAIQRSFVKRYMPKEIERSNLSISSMSFGVSHRRLRPKARMHVNHE
jgi:hypothetical protein